MFDREEMLFSIWADQHRAAVMALTERIESLESWLWETERDWFMWTQLSRLRRR